MSLQPPPGMTSEMASASEIREANGVHMAQGPSLNPLLNKGMPLYRSDKSFHNILRLMETAEEPYFHHEPSLASFSLFCMLYNEKYDTTGKRFFTAVGRVPENSWKRAFVGSCISHYPFEIEDGVSLLEYNTMRVFFIDVVVIDPKADFHVTIFIGDTEAKICFQGGMLDPSHILELSSYQEIVDWIKGHKFSTDGFILLSNLIKWGADFDHLLYYFVLHLLEGQMKFYPGNSGLDGSDEDRMRRCKVIDFLCSEAQRHCFIPESLNRITAAIMSFETSRYQSSFRTQPLRSSYGIDFTSF